MKPGLIEVIAFLAKEMPAHAAQVESPFLRKQLGATGMALTIISQEIDRAVPRRLEENAAIRAIFRTALSVVTDPALERSLAEEALRQEDDLRLSSLEAENDRLRELLIQLHACVETISNPAAYALNETIWQELRLQTERRR